MIQTPLGSGNLEQSTSARREFRLVRRIRVFALIRSAQSRFVLYSHTATSLFSIKLQGSPSAYLSALRPVPVTTALSVASLSLLLMRSLIYPLGLACSLVWLVLMYV